MSAARAKLAALAPVRRQSGPTSPRRVIADQTTFVNDVSPDGRLAVGLTAGLDTRLVLQDPSTGETTTLVAGTQAAFGRWPVFSADGQQLAYSWTERGSGTGSLRVVGTSAGAPSRTILAADPERGQVMPLGWSADGKAILALLGGGRIAWIAVADGAVRVIKSLEAWRKVPSVDANNGLVYPRLSPDGNSIAYSAVARDGSPDRYIYVIGANGQNEATVVSVAGANTHPVWTADGSHLLYLTDRSGSRDLMAVAIRGGAAGGGALAPPGRVCRVSHQTHSNGRPVLPAIRRPIGNHVGVGGRAQSCGGSRRSDVQRSERHLVEEQPGGVLQASGGRGRG